MGKRDDLMKDAGNIMESMGQGAPAPAAATASTPAHLKGVDRMRDAKLIPLDLIEPDPDQPRKEFEPESLDRLARSLKGRGQLQPIRVRWDDEAASYVILMGERRWRAARQAGLEKLACVVHDSGMSDGERRALQLIENCLREDLKPIEQARAYRALMTSHEWSARRLADELDLNHATVLRALALLDLPEGVQARVEAGELSPSAAAELARLTPDEATSLAERVTTEHLTRDQVSEAVREKVGHGERPTKKPRPLEVRLDDGVRIVIHGITDPDAAAAALKQAVRKLTAASRNSDRAA